MEGNLGGLEEDTRKKARKCMHMYTRRQTFVINSIPSRKKKKIEIIITIPIV